MRLTLIFWGLDALFQDFFWKLFIALNVNFETFLTNFVSKVRVQRTKKFIILIFAKFPNINLIFIFAYILRLGLGLGKLRNRTGGPGGLPTGFGLGKLRYRPGGPGGLPPGFGLGKLRYRTGGPGLAPWVRVR